MKKNPKKFSREHLLYLRKIKQNKFLVISSRILILVAIILIWEILGYFKIIDTFIMSSPSRILKTLTELFKTGELFYHTGITLYETFVGFLIASVLGSIIALLLWYSENLRKILDPYIIVLNSLPKIALGPIIIIWFGAGQKSIIFMAVLIAIIVTIITMLNGFLQTEKDKILLLQSMGATKAQILLKLVIPGNKTTFISMLKINVGMAWIGSIMGEYLVSRAGLGFLIVYGGQVFKLDLVMASTVILCLLAGLMYFLVTILEKFIIKEKE